MNAHEMGNQQTLENQVFALAARLHVILRRGKGRITDVEYMRQDHAYCRHVLGLIDSAEPEEVRTLCAKLEELYFGSHGLFVKYAPKHRVASPRAPLPLPPMPLAAMLSPQAPMPPPLSAPAANTAKYIGRLR